MSGFSQLSAGRWLKPGVFVASMFVPEATFLEVISGDGPDMGWGVVGSAPRELAEG